MNDDHSEDRRTQRKARTARREQVSQDIMREQVREVTMSAPYAGPVGTKVPEWERVLIQHLVPKRERMVRKSVQELREEVRQVRATREAGRLRDAEMIERSAREHGFGGRVGVTL